jgi:hypothetical protein
MNLSKETIKLIKGENISIIDNETFCKVRNELRQIKKNCTLVLSKMNEQ